ncbi:MAG: sulfhydrogenase subunit alpha [Rhodothermales bacterium]|jgi:sulfhydrogenase subunit alpha
MPENRTIKVDYLARVEGEGALHLQIVDGKVADAKLKIFEPPRFFEALLRGRDFREAPDITSRICGICPVAYELGAINAMESITGPTPEAAMEALRRLVYCGEWIESHVLHIYMLHAPDFLGYPDAVRMARDYPDIVKRGLRLKKIGNEILELLGGRAIHPINLRVGGVHRLPEPAQMRQLTESLTWARDAAAETVEWVASFDFPDFSRDYEFVALHHPDEYAITRGRIVSNRGLDIAIDEFEDHVEEHHVPHSTALHASLLERGHYFVGPMARFNLNYDQLSDQSRRFAESANLTPSCRNPFKSIIIRAIEVFYACEEALAIIDRWQPPTHAFVDAPPRAGRGHGCTEAPRGICYHRYDIDAEGNILEARIVPPTSQNQSTIEDDLYAYCEQYIDLPDDELQWRCEQAIRNYDPCISCSCHFLKLTVDRK